MKSVAYPIILEKEADGYFVTVPDIDRYTQGEDIADAMEMARDLICLWLLDLEESGKVFRSLRRWSLMSARML